MFGASGVTGLNIYSMIVAIVGSIVVLLIYNAVIRSSAPGGNIGKPLADCSPRPTGFGREEVALGLLRAQVRRRHQTKGLVAYSEDWAGYWTNCRRVGWATWPIPGSVLAKISRCRIIQLGPALGPDIIKTLAQRSGLSEEELTKQSVAGSAGGRRQADPRWPTADVSGVI
jgi:Transglycosylase associated protein